MNFILIRLDTLKVVIVTDHTLLRGRANTDFVELEVDTLPDGCVVGATARQDGDKWVFTAPNHRLKAKEMIHRIYDYDHVNLDAIETTIGCVSTMARAVHQDQVADSPLAISMNRCILDFDTLKRGVNKRKYENRVIHALVGGDSTASSNALVTLSADTINATIELVHEVSANYGAAGLALLEAHFNDSMHFNADGGITLPRAVGFAPVEPVDDNMRGSDEEG